MFIISFDIIQKLSKQNGKKYDIIILIVVYIILKW